MVFAEEIKSPKQQLKEGIQPQDVICKENRVLVIRNGVDALCLKDTTAQKLNFEIIKIFEVQPKMNKPVQEETKTTESTVSHTIKDLTLDQIYEVTGVLKTLDIEWNKEYDKSEFSKTIVHDKPFEGSALAGIVHTHFSSLEFSEYVPVGEEFDVTVKWTFTEYDEEGNVEHQNVPINSLTKEIFDETLLQIRIPQNIEMITDVSDWDVSTALYHDTSFNFNNTFTTYSKTISFDYADAMHEQVYRFKLNEPFFPPFDYMTFGGLGFGKKIHHQDGELIPPQLDEESVNVIQDAITVERLGIIDPHYPEVSPEEVNWKKASDVAPKGINTPDEPDNSQSQAIRDFYINVLNRNPTNDELLATGVSQEWIDGFFEKYPELTEAQIDLVDFISGLTRYSCFEQ